MNTALEVIKAVTSEAIQARFDVQPRVVRHYGSIGRFPASWYVVLSDMAGCQLPLTLFSFKGLDQ
jgi:hypothetical protein